MQPPSFVLPTRTLSTENVIYLTHTHTHTSYQMQNENEERRSFQCFLFECETIHILHNCTDKTISILAVDMIITLKWCDQRFYLQNNC